jgi:O-antigen/teichoic acid export membrane protein
MSEKALFGKFKELGSHTLIYGAGSVLQTALGFILIPLYTKYYSPEMYGELALITICGTIGASIFYFGVHSALSRSYYDKPEGFERKKTISTTFYILLFGALLQISLGFLLKGQLSFLLFHNYNYAYHIFFILCGSALGFVSNLFLMLLRFERKSKIVIIFNLANLVISTGLILYLLIIAKIGIMAPILGTFLSQFLFFFVLYFFSRRSIIFAFSIPESILQLKWGFSIVLSNFGVLILDWSDRFQINKFCSTDDVGIYSLGYKIGMLITVVLIIPLSQIWDPIRMQYRHDKNAASFYSLSITYYFIFGLFVAVGLSIFSKELIEIMSRRSDYLPAYKVIPIIVFSYLLIGCGELTNHGIVFERKVHYGIWLTWLSAGMVFGLNLIFIPLYGFIAAAYTRLFTFLIGRIVGIMISNHYYKIVFEKRRLAILIASSCAAIALSNLFVNFSLLAAISVKATVLAMLVSSWWIFVLSPKEKGKVKTKFLSLIPNI